MNINNIPCLSHLRTAFALAILLSAAGTLAAPPMQNISAAESESAKLVIHRPVNDATIFDNEGNVPVEIEVPPALTLADSAHLELILDGEPVPFHNGTLTGITRGTHQLQARIVENGSTLAESEPVTFHIWQASRLFPGRK